VRTDGGLDLTPMLAPDLAKAAGGPVSWAGFRNDRPEARPPLDEAWVEPALEAIERGVPYVVDSKIANRDRAIGARLSGEIALLRVNAEVPVDVTLNLTGTAGQSFGAFTAEGMKLVLEGQANDFVGKGLSGGEIVIRARGLAAKESGKHVILGNVALYGATSGSLYAAGRAGERFAVRNSGATAVIEGVGDHGCEYMTGGTVAVLGRAGMNFGAGMTGGLAWVYDADGSFIKGLRYHPEFLEAEAFAAVSDEAKLSLKELLTVHAERSLSTLSQQMLDDWEMRAQAFVRLTPKPQA
jgi:glutamate synthase (ferredoxin)